MKQDEKITLLLMLNQDMQVISNFKLSKDLHRGVRTMSRIFDKVE